MTNKAIFITVRTGSTRLKNKSILKIKDKHTIEYVIDAAKTSKYAKDIILCTSTNPNDKILCDIAEKNNIKWFRGSEENKWHRWDGACKKYNINFFATADGDDLFYSSGLADACFKQFMSSPEDIIIDGQGLYNDVYGFSNHVIKTIAELDESINLEPHHAISFLKNKKFKIEKIKNYKKIYEKRNVRMTLDYPEDFNFFKNIIELIDNNDYNIKKIYELIDANPEIAKINFFLEEKWKENQKKEGKK